MLTESMNEQLQEFRKAHVTCKHCICCHLLIFAVAGSTQSCHLMVIQLLWLVFQLHIHVSSKRERGLPLHQVGKLER